MASFQWPYDGNTVAVTGCFNNWSEHIPLTKDQKGVWHTSIHLEPGTYEYKFVVDGYRWCFDILKPHRADDRGNRNNVIIVGKGQSAPPKSAQQAHSQHKDEAHAQPKAEEPQVEQPAETKTETKGGRKEKQQKQQPQKQEAKGGEKQKKVSGAAKGASQKVISTVKSYNAPWFVADVEIEDNEEDVLECAKLFATALPTSACMFVSGGQHSFIIAAVVPDEKTGDLTATDWVTTALTVLASPPEVKGTNNLAHATVAADPDKGIFPLKLKDLTRGPVFMLLKKKGLVKDEDDDDEGLPSFDDL
jgi:hypothetical protein